MNKEYIPIFGVGGIDETRTWSSQSRPIKFTPYVYDYYDIELKKARLKNIETVSLSKKNWLFESFSIENNSKLNDLFIKYKPILTKINEYNAT